MSNLITVNYLPCEPAPADGYLVKYRPLGSSDPLRTWPVNFFPSPAELLAGVAAAAFLTSEDPDGTQYEGEIYGDCGSGGLGVASTWTTADESSGSDSVSCTPVEFVEGSLPNGVEGVEYDVDLNLTGTAPFTLGTVTKPSWMTVVVFGSHVHLGGTPDAEGSDEEVTIEVTNCDGAESDIFSTTIDVVGSDGVGFISNSNCGSSGARIDNVQWNGLDPLVLTGDFPVMSGQEIQISHGVSGGPHTLEVFATNDAGVGTIQAIDSTGAVFCAPFNGTGNYSFPGFVINLVNWSVHMDCEVLCS